MHTTATAEPAPSPTLRDLPAVTNAFERDIDAMGGMDGADYPEMSSPIFHLLADCYSRHGLIVEEPRPVSHEFDGLCPTLRAL